LSDNGDIAECLRDGYEKAIGSVIFETEYSEVNIFAQHYKGKYYWHISEDDASAICPDLGEPEEIPKYLYDALTKFEKER